MKAFLQKLSLRDLGLAITGGGLGISFASVLYVRELFCFGFVEAFVMLGIAGALCLAAHYWKKPPLMIAGLMLLCLTCGLLLLLVVHICFR